MPSPLSQPPFKASPSHPPELRAAYARRQQMYQWCTLALSLRKDRHEYEATAQDLVLFKELVLDLQRTPPLGITLDLMALWRHGTQFVPRPLHQADQPFARFYLQLQNEIYYRLVRQPTFQALRRRWLALPEPPKRESPQAIPGMPSQLPSLSLKDRALVYLVALLYQPISDALIESFRPHALAPFSPGEPPEWLDAPLDMIEQLEADLHEPGWLSLHLNAIVQRWNRLHISQWLPASAQQILTHFPLLPNKLQRIRWEQLAQVEASMPPCQRLQHFFALRDHGYRESLLPTRSTAPEGGYHGICRKGAMENMLHSELMYWDDSFGEEHFSLRWIEGELLFYEREQSRSFTWQRQLVLALDLDPGEIRYKHPSHPVPGHTLLFGFLARLFQELRQICPEELLRFSLHLGPESEWREDAPLLQLYFSHLPQIGASTTLELRPQPLQWLQRQPPAGGEMRLLIVSASRWHALRHQAATSSRSIPHHLSLVWTTDPQSLQPQQQAGSAGEGDSSEQDAVHSTSSDDHHATPAPPVASTAGLDRRMLRMKRQPGEMPDFAFFLNEHESPFLALTQLREDVLESILKTSLVPKT